MGRLYDLTGRVVGRIESLDPEVEAPRFRRELEKARPDLIEKLGRQDAPGIFDRLSVTLLGLVKEIPVIVGALCEAAAKRSTHPTVRCAMVGALAYLVQPRDLIPDDCPGGFGFIDDSLILRATVSEYFDALPPGFTDAERERQNIRLLALCIPPDRLFEFQSQVDGVWHLFHRLLLLPLDSVDRAISRFEKSPLEASLFEPAPASEGLPPGPDLSLARDCTLRLSDEGPCLVFHDGVEVFLGNYL
jgi:uncharacterized membrane protein YkvA (DUF1232 family)